MSATAIVLALVCAPAAHSGDEPAHKLGDHPAVIVQRLQKTAGYDYASKFYPHPAWLWLSSQPPSDTDGTAPVAANARETAPGPVLSAAREGDASAARVH